jgi:hypothetical protein
MCRCLSQRYHKWNPDPVHGWLKGDKANSCDTSKNKDFTFTVRYDVGFMWLFDEGSQ